VLVAVVEVEVVWSVVVLFSCVLVLIFVYVTAMKEGKVYVVVFVVLIRWLGMLHLIGHWMICLWTWSAGTLDNVFGGFEWGLGKVAC